MKNRQRVAGEKGAAGVKRLVALAVVLGFPLLLAASISAASKPGGPYWPAPPPNARLAFVSQFRSEKDFAHAKRTLWEKVKRLLVGHQEEWALSSPYGLDVWQNRLYVADAQAHTVWVADFGGETFSPFVRSREEAPLLSPIGVAVEEDGRVFVSDTSRNSVLVFSPKGKPLAVLGEKRFGRPTGLAVDRPRHRLYVVDTARNEVVVFSTASLKEVRRFGRPGTGPGEFNLPVHVSVRAGLVYLVDTLNFRVQIFGPDGDFVGQFGQMGDGPGDLPRPKGVGVDSEGNVYVADALFDNVQVFDRLGRLLMSFGGLGEKAGQFWLPVGLAVDERNRVYVVDSANRRVQVFQYLGRGGE